MKRVPVQAPARASVKRECQHLSKPGSRANVRRPFSPAWVILFAGLLTAAVVLVMRGRASQPTALEALIAENEPIDHVHAIAITPGGTTYVATHLGLLARQGQGDTKWHQSPAGTNDIIAMAPAGGENLYLTGDGMGIQLYADGQYHPLLVAQQIAALASDPQDRNRVLAYAKGLGVIESHDRGKTWQQFAVMGGADVYALTVHPQDGNTIVVGGVNGFLAVTKDGGHTWTYPPALSGSVSALSFDPRQPQRLWATAGGYLQTTDDLGATWRSVPADEAKGRTVVALAFPPAGGGGPTAATPEGFLFTLSN
jgi:hypothetical protein